MAFFGSNKLEDMNFLANSAGSFLVSKGRKMVWLFGLVCGFFPSLLMEATAQKSATHSESSASTHHAAHRQMVKSSKQEQQDLPYKRFPTVPPFELTKEDGKTKISKSNLKKNQPVVVMFFSPDCDHCQHQTEDIIKNISALKEVQIVMATYQPLETLMAFKQKYGLEKYPNILVGRDTQYFLPSFFGVKSLPFLAFYNKKWDLLSVHQGNLKPADFLKRIQGK